MTFLHSGYNSKIDLSAKEMLEISQEISRDFSPYFSSQMPKLVKKTKFSARELLDISEEIRRDFAPKAFSNTPELMLLPVDPGHLYAYWHLGENRKSFTPENNCKDQLTLRIYSQPDEERTGTTTETAPWFDVAIDSPKTQQQVSLPRSIDETAYSAAIGTCCADDSFIAFAHSTIVHAFHGRRARRQEQENAPYCLSKNASGQGIGKQA